MQFQDTPPGQPGPMVSKAEGSVTPRSIATLDPAADVVKVTPTSSLAEVQDEPLPRAN